MQVVDPSVMGSSHGRRDMLLENNDIGIGDFLCVDGGEHGSSGGVDGGGGEVGVKDGGGRGEQEERGETDKGLHDGQMGWKKEGKTRR